MRKYLISLLVIIFFNSTLSYCQNITKHLIAYWSFDDSTAHDFSGNGYDGSIYNHPQPVPGVNGKTAFFFEGKGNYLVVGQNPNLIGDFITVPPIDFTKIPGFTITMWFRYDSLSYYYGDGLLFYGLCSGWLGMMFHIVQIPSLGPLSYVYSVGDQVVSPSSLRKTFVNQNSGKWVFLCETYANGTLTAYFNGQLVGSQQQNINILDKSAGIATCWWYEGTEHRQSARLSGTLDEIMIFNEALTPCEIKELNKAIEINNLPKLTLVFDSCKTDTATIVAPGNYIDYKWSTGETNTSIIVTKSGVYSLIGTDTTGCQDTLDINVELKKFPVPKILATKKDCSGDTTEIEVEGNFLSYKWSTGETTKEINIKKAGKYSVVVIDSTGCTKTAEVEIFNNSSDKSVDIILEQDNGKIRFDSIGVFGSVYKDVKIMNLTDSTLVIDNIYLYINTNFSIPQSQIPICLKPKESKSIRLYFSPKELGRLTDTLLLMAPCVRIQAILTGFSEANNYFGNSSCNLPVYMTTQNITSKHYIAFSLPEPNPATEIIKIPSTVEKGYKIDYIHAILYDLYGNAYYPKVEFSNFSIQNSTNFDNFKIIIHIENLSQGLYFLKIMNGDFREYFKILIEYGLR